jgi:ATP-binding protein involved in chromosome partitioning
MFRKVAVPVIGIVENMSIHVCSNCGHEEAIFGQGGGKAVAGDYETELLGQLPLTLKLREQSDVGTPIVISDPDAVTSVTIREVADKVQTFVEKNVSKAPVINIFND